MAKNTTATSKPMRMVGSLVLPRFYKYFWGRTSPLFVYGKAVASPPHPCKVLGFHPKPHKFFEKNLTKNFYVSPPGFCGGTRPCGTQEGGSSCAATRRELPGVQPPRTCFNLLMSTSEASCHRRDLRAQALRRTQLPEARTALTEPRCSSSYLFFLTNRYTMAITARMAITVPTPKPPPTNRVPIWYTIKETT